MSSFITFGKEVCKIDVDGFVLTKTYHAPSTVLPKHSHEFANINLTLNGSFRETMSNRVNDAGPYSILVKPPGESHSNVYGDKGADCLVIEIKPYRLESVKRQSNLFESPTYLRNGVLPLIRRIDLEFSMRLNASEIMIEGLILELLAETSRRSMRTDKTIPPRSIRHAREYIHEHFCGGIRLSRLAKLLDVNPTYLARTFRKHYGASIGEYVRRLQLEHSAKHLADSDRSIAQIAIDAGFYDQSHFTKVFKHFFRVSPAKYRALLNKQ